MALKHEMPQMFGATLNCKARWYWANIKIASLLVQALLVLTFCGPEALAQSAAMPRAEAEAKMDALSQKVELLEKSNTVRWDALEKIRAAEIKALEDKIDVKEKLLEVKKDVIANAQKSVDWWLAISSVLLAVFGVAIPILFTLKIRQEYAAHISEIARAREEMQDLLIATQVAEADAKHAQAGAHDTKCEIEFIRDKAKCDADQLLIDMRESADSTTRINAEMQALYDSISGRNAADTKTKIDPDVFVASKLHEGAPQAIRALKRFAAGAAALRAGNFAEAATQFAASTAEDPVNPKSYFAWGLSIGALADMAEGEERRNLRLEEISKYEAALKIKSDSHVALNSWGVALGQLADAVEGEERRKLLQEATAKFETALKIKANKHDALYNWGIALARLAETVEGEERRKIRLEEITKYEAALKIKPDEYKALYNWGVALARLAEAADGEERREQLLAAITKYEAALTIKPNEHDALYGWGLALARLAGAADGEARCRLLLAAITKFEAALTIKPDGYETLYNWGVALARLADAAEGEERRNLRLGAITKYEATLKIKPDKHVALGSWGAALLQLAGAVQGEDRKLLLEAAEEKLEEHQRMIKRASYNLACLAALRGDVLRFIAIFDSLEGSDKPDRAHLERDQDLNDIRTTPEFKAWWIARFGAE